MLQVGPRFKSHPSVAMINLTDVVEKKAAFYT